MQMLTGSKLLVIARVVEKDKLIGFLVMDTMHGSSHVFSIEGLQMAYNSGQKLEFLNAIYDRQYGTLDGTHKASLTGYPAINRNFVVVDGKYGLTVMCLVFDSKTKTPMGVLSFNSIGQRFAVSLKKFAKLADTVVNTNFKFVVDPNYGTIPVRKDGSQFDFVFMEKPETVTKTLKENVEEIKNNPVKQASPNDMPVIKVTNFNESDNKVAQSAQDKFLAAMLNMQKLTPYYYTVFMAIKRIPAPGMGTMGVTEDTLYYDAQFIAGLSVSELTFVLIHEVLHLAMQHSLRFGGRKDHSLWNIATDLYINSIICKDFGVKFNSDEVKVRLAAEDKKSERQAVIKTPGFGVYMETIGGTIDLAVETPESIYEDLLKENQAGQQALPDQQSDGSGSSGMGGADIKSALKQGMEQMSNGNSTGQSAMNSAQSGGNPQSDAASSALSQVMSGAKDVKSGMKSGDSGQVQKGMDKIHQGVESLKGLNDDACFNQLEKGTNDIKSGSEMGKDNCNQSESSKQAGDNIEKALSDLMNNIGKGDKEGTQNALNNVSQSINDMGQAQEESGVSDTNPGKSAMDKMRSGQRDLNDCQYGQQMNDNMDSAESKTQQGVGNNDYGETKSGLNDLVNSAKSAKSNIDKASDGSQDQSQAKEGSDKIQDGLDQMQQGLDNNDARQVQQGMQKAQQGMNQAQSAMQNEMQRQLQQGMNQMQNGANQAQQNSGNSKDSKNASQDIKDALDKVQRGIQNGDSSQTQQGLDDLQKAMDKMNQAQNNAGQGGTPQGQQASQQMQSGMESLQNAANMQSSMQQMQEGMSQMQQAMQQASQGSGSGQGQGQGQKVFGASSSNQGQAQDGGDQKGDFEDSLNDLNGEAENPFESMKAVNVVYKGKRLQGNIMTDVMTSNPSRKKEDRKENIDKSRKALQRIKTKVELERKERNQDLLKNAGAGGNLTQRYIEVGLSAGVDWRVLCKNMCKDKPKKTFTLASPNKEYMNMHMTLADRRAIGKPTHVSHIKFAIDVSGSVSQKELEVMISEINNIFNHFKVDGELIYWSTEIGDAGNFSSLKDMLRVAPNSTGGTDVRCVFDYLSGKDKVKGKREEDKPRDIKGIFIITDGYFSDNYSDYTRMFGKKVVWLITGQKGNPITFDPPFGKVIGLNMD